MLRNLIAAAGGRRRPLYVSHLDQLKREPSGPRVRRALADASSALGLDRLSPLRSIRIPDWREIRGALPDGPTILLRLLSRPDASAEPFPSPSLAVMVPLARISVESDIAFSSSWDPEREGYAQARTRLKREFAAMLDETIAAAVEHAASVGSEPQPSACLDCQ